MRWRGVGELNNSRCGLEGISSFPKVDHEGVERSVHTRRGSRD